MTAIQIKEAQTYNLLKSQKLWDQKSLPAPLNSPNILPDSEAFALSIATFQANHNLVVDGKLGPATLSAMRAVATPGVEIPGNGKQPTASVPVRKGVSNVILLGGQRVTLPQHMLDMGITCTNWLDDDETHFDSRKRTKTVQHLVIHESVTTSVTSTERVLKGKGYGTHIMIAPDGALSCHNDLLTEQVIHGNQLNGSSIGVEVVNPYCPAYAKAPWTETIQAAWWTWVPQGHKRLYVLPTKAQIETLYQFSKWITTVIPSLPWDFPTLSLGPKQPKIPDWDKKAKPGPGIVAHRDFSTHADGRYPLDTLIWRRA